MKASSHPRIVAHGLHGRVPPDRSLTGKTRDRHQVVTGPGFWAMTTDLLGVGGRRARTTHEIEDATPHRQDRVVQVQLSFSIVS